MAPGVRVDATQYPMMDTHVTWAHGRARGDALPYAIPKPSLYDGKRFGEHQRISRENKLLADRIRRVKSHYSLRVRACTSPCPLSAGPHSPRLLLLVPAQEWEKSSRQSEEISRRLSGNGTTETVFADRALRPATRSGLRDRHSASHRSVGTARPVTSTGRRRAPPPSPAARGVATVSRQRPLRSAPARRQEGRQQGGSGGVGQRSKPPPPSAPPRPTPSFPAPSIQWVAGDPFASSLTHVAPATQQYLMAPDPQAVATLTVAPAPGPSSPDGAPAHMARAVPSLRLLRNAGATENMNGLLQRLSRRGRGRGRAASASSSRRQRPATHKARAWQHAHHPARSDDWLGLPPSEGQAERDVRALGRATTAAGLARRRRRRDASAQWGQLPPPHAAPPTPTKGDGDLLDLTPRSGGSPLADASSQRSTPWSWQEAVEAAEAAGATARVGPAVDEAPEWRPGPSTASQEWWRRHAEKYNRAPPPGSQPTEGFVRRPSLSLRLVPDEDEAQPSSPSPPAGTTSVRGRWRKAIVAAAAVARFEGGSRRRKSSLPSPTEPAAVRTYQRRPTSVLHRRSSTYSLQDLMEVEGRRPSSRSSPGRYASPLGSARRGDAVPASPPTHSAGRGPGAPSSGTGDPMWTPHTPGSDTSAPETGGQESGFQVVG